MRSHVCSLALGFLLLVTGCGENFGTSLQAITPDGGADAGSVDGGAADSGSSSPRLVPRNYTHNGAVVGGPVGLYDKVLGTPCHPDITTEGKTRCIPDGGDLDGFYPVGVLFLDAGCLQPVLMQTRSQIVCPANKLVGRYVVVKSKSGADQCTPKASAVRAVGLVEVAMTTPPTSLWRWDNSNGCVYWAKDVPSTVLTLYDLYPATPVLFSSMAELAEVH